jgi:hypothetical protein
MPLETPHQHEIREHELVVVDEAADGEGIHDVGRFIALLGGAFVAVLGTMAALMIDWSDATATSPVVDVADLPFTPAVAGVTLVLGLLLISAAAARGGDGRLTLGVITAVFGLAVVLTDDRIWPEHVIDRHGWLALGIGSLFILTGMLDEYGWRTRVRRTQRYVS